MSSVFPGAIDDFDTSMTSGGLMNSPSHAAQHQKIGDALEKIETKVLAEPSGDWTKLSADAPAGQGFILVESVPERLAGAGGAAVIIGVFHPDCHIDYIVPASVVGNRINLPNNLDANRVKGDRVYFFNLAEGPIPFSFLGGIGGNSSTNATANTNAWNRIMNYSGFTPAGKWYRWGTVWMLLDTAYAFSDSINYSISHHMIQSAFSATTGGMYSYGIPYSLGGGDYKSLLRQYDQVGNLPSLLNVTADGTCWHNNYFIDCRGESNSIAHIYSPQQPGRADNIRILSTRNPAGGYIFGAQNVWAVQNFQGNDNCASAYAFHNPYCMRDVNVSSPFPVAGIQHGLIWGGYNGTLEGQCDIETCPAPGPLISVSGGGHRLNFSTSGLSGSPGVIVLLDDSGENPEGKVGLVELTVRCEGADTGFKVLRDVQRNSSIQAWPTDIPDRTLKAFALGDSALWVKPGGGANPWSPFYATVPHAA